MNIVRHQKNVFRGFHFQSRNQQAKFVNVFKGTILDIVIDLERIQKLSEKYLNNTFKSSLGLYIPAGFAHAYYSYEKENIIYYYSPKYENGILFNDKIIKIK